MNIPTIHTPINPILNEWVDKIPSDIREKTTLMDFLMRVCDGIYRDENGTENDYNGNPFYKIIEILRAENLTYDGLETIMEYYHVDIARYLIDKNLGEYYLGYPCNNKKQLKKALSPKNNMTDNSTLIAILSNIV